MDQARTDRAMSRIEAALARIERAAARPPVSAPVGSQGGWTAYHALKGNVRGVLGELDGVIAELER